MTIQHSRPQNNVNQWGYLTRLDIDIPRIDVTSFSDPNFVSVAGPGRVRFSGEAPATDAITTLLQEWMRNGIRTPIWTPEWRCLYCGSPQKLDRTHCEKCGGPRSWILG